MDRPPVAPRSDSRKSSVGNQAEASGNPPHGARADSLIKDFAPNIVMFPNPNELLPNGQFQRINTGTAEERKAFLAYFWTPTNAGRLWP